MIIALPTEVEYLLSKLKSSGYQAYIVGGCVRDYLLGKTPHDWDICTSALPAEVIAVFDNEKVIETGLEHGTVTVIINSTAYEITTFRTESDYSDNRRPDNVSFVTNVADDLARRDFTINAMAYNNEAGLVDLFGGRKDICDKLIKTVGDSSKRFSEDALRILRALRFSANLGFNIDPATGNNIHSKKYLLNNISSERIWAEFKQLLMGENVVKVLREYVDVISVFIPQIGKMVGFKQHSPYHCYDVWEHTLHALENAPNDIIVRLAIVFHDIGKPETFFIDQEGTGHFHGHPKVSRKITENVFNNLRVDNYTKNTVLTLVENHDKIINPTEKSVKKTIQRLGSTELFEQLIALKKSDAWGQSLHLAIPRINSLNTLLNIERQLLEEKRLILSVKELAVNGYDIISLGVTEGKQIGMVLDELLSLVIDNNVQNRRKELLCAAKKIVSELN